MSDSDEPDGLERKREQNRQRRIDTIKRWVRYVENNPPEIWGRQQNRLVDSQLESARETGLSAEHYRRVDRAGTDRSER